jgi:hypothetical protein
LTYIVHAASTELATHEAVAFGFNPRRNRCFHSSICKVMSLKHRGARSRTTDTSVGLVTTIARTTTAVSPRESEYCTSRSRHGQPRAAARWRSNVSATGPALALHMPRA